MSPRHAATRSSGVKAGLRPFAAATTRVNVKELLRMCSTSGQRKVLIISVSRVSVSLHLIQPRGGFGEAGLCVYTPEYLRFDLSENLCLSERGSDLFDCKIDHIGQVGGASAPFACLN